MADLGHAHDGAFDLNGCIISSKAVDVEVTVCQCSGRAFEHPWVCHCSLFPSLRFFHSHIVVRRLSCLEPIRNPSYLLEGLCVGHFTDP